MQVAFCVTSWGPSSGPALSGPRFRPCPWEEALRTCRCVCRAAVAGAGARVLAAACAGAHVPAVSSLCPQGRGGGSQHVLAECVTSSLSRRPPGAALTGLPSQMAAPRPPLPPPGAGQHVAGGQALGGTEGGAEGTVPAALSTCPGPFLTPACL